MTTVVARGQQGAQAAAWALGGAAAAAAIGILGGIAPQYAAVVAAGAVFVGLVFNIPATVLSVALLALAVSPEYLGPSAGVLARPELQKGLLYASLLPIVLLRGVRWSMALPVFAYVIAATLTVVLGHRAANLSTSQMLSSFATLVIGWLALSVRWVWPRDLRYLKVVAALPIASLVIGVVLQGIGMHTLVAHGSGVGRLQGASIAAQLALTSLVSATSAYVLYRQFRWRPAPYLLAADAAILVATFSRGAMIALAIVLLIPLLRFVIAPLVRRPRVAVARAVTAVVVLGVATAAVAPTIAARNDKGFYIPGQGFQADTTSGRSEAWKEFYAIAKQSPLFGHGLGSGPITKIHQQGFLAQHNEYLRFYLENGYVGGILILLSIIIVVTRAVRLAPRRIRIDLTLAVLAIAVLSATDNTLTSVNLTLPLGLLLGICSSGRHRPRIDAA